MAMKNKTRRALVLSVLSLILCCSMLVGTTFAWFTDNVTNGVNTIQSGNLDIELYHANYFDAVANGSISGFGMTKNYEGHKVEANTALFLNKAGEPILWEPGATAVENFRIKNEGSVALKYTFKLDILNATKTPAGKDLTEILELYIDDITYDASNNDLPVGTTVVSGEKLGNGYVLEGTLEANEERNFWIGLEWEPTDYDNDFNVKGGLKLNLGVTLQATQHTFEYDGYNGNTYDAGATYDVLATPDTFVEGGEDKDANTQALADAIKAADSNGDGQVALQLGSGSYSIPAAKGKELTIAGNGNTVLELGVAPGEGANGNLDGSDVVFENLTIKTDSKNYTGYARMDATYNNCVIDGTYTLYGNSVFNNCTFKVSGDVYNIWTWGAPEATFNNCTFISDGKAMLLYGTVNTKLNINGCTFEDNGALTDLKAAIEIGNDYDKSYNLTVNNTTVNGYEINDKGIGTGTTLWANKNSMPQDKLNVVVDGVDVY